IGIDVIGFERVCPDPAFDQARNGIVRGNVVYNINSYGNPAYGKSHSAGCIYIDGGKDTLIEGNIVYDSDIGIEIASEHKGRATSNIKVRNNLIYNNVMGLAMGGYDTERGYTENCTVTHNILYHNDRL